MTVQSKAGSRPLLRRPVHHVGFLVDDLEVAVSQWVKVYGAGPFFLLEHMEFDQVTSRGEPIRWDHSAAFGQWGGLAVELQQFHDVQPADLVALMSSGRRHGINHVAYVVDDPREESARLEAMGYPAFVNAKFGDIDVTFHDTIDVFGYTIEIHQAGPALDGFFNAISGASRGWDGEDPIRSPDPLT